MLLTLLTTLCNRSIRYGILPPSQKKPILISVLKGDGLDPANPMNYRPIANVSFISKIIEKIVAGQLIVHIERNNLLPPCQSGFRKFNRNSTAPLLSDMYGAIDRTELTLLALFDVSAAFDTVDHDILVTRLHVKFGLSGNLVPGQFDADNSAQDNSERTIRRDSLSGTIRRNIYITNFIENPASTQQYSFHKSRFHLINFFINLASVSAIFF